MILVIAELSEITVKSGKRHVNNSFKAAWLHIGGIWHTQFRPKHFTLRGAREYGYIFRQGENLDRNTKGFRRSYHARKLRVKGHGLPLVWSGQSRARSAIRRIRATFKGVTISLPTPALNLRNKASPIHMLTEIRTVSEREKQILIREWQVAFRNELARLGRTHTIRIRY